jgi:hypothetical protein
MKKLLVQFSLVLCPGVFVFGQGQSAMADASGAQSELVKVYVKQDPATYKKTTQDTLLALEFAVQLSASSRPIADKSSLKSWEELGPVYIHSENGMYKVRLGPFDSQDKAKEVLLQAKGRGKKDAFIVIQKGLENYAPQGYARLQSGDVDMMETPTAPVVTQPQIVPAPAPATIPVDEEITEYKVRLASYLKPGGFSTKDVDQYGPLESYRKGEWTILMIGGFKTEQDAIRVRDLVIPKGFKDARVVADRGGILDLED